MRGERERMKERKERERERERERKKGTREGMWRTDYSVCWIAE